MKSLIAIALIFSLAMIFSCAEKQKEKVGLIEKEVEYSADGTVLKVSSSMTAMLKENDLGY